MFWGRAIPIGARTRPLLIVLEEAHAYLSAQSKSRAAAAARRIAKEGRKYGVGLMLVSQRPSEIDPTILAQCGTLIVGEAVGLPVRALIEPPALECRPDSDDPKVVVPLGSDGKPVRPGGWTDAISSENYSSLVKCWRAQDALAGNPPADDRTNNGTKTDK